MKHFDEIKTMDFLANMTLSPEAQRLADALNTLDCVDNTVCEYAEELDGDKEARFKKIGEAYINYRNVVVDILTKTMSKKK